MLMQLRHGIHRGAVPRGSQARSSGCELETAPSSQPGLADHEVVGGMPSGHQRLGSAESRWL